MWPEWSAEGLTLLREVSIRSTVAAAAGGAILFARIRSSAANPGKNGAAQGARSTYATLTGWPTGANVSRNPPDS